jgi:hypothetical protein
MPLDASIIMGLKPLEMPDFAKIQSDAQTNQLNQMKLQEAQQGVADQNAFRSYMAGGGSISSPDIYNYVNPEKVGELRKKNLEGQKLQGEVDDRTQLNHVRMILGVSDQRSALAMIQAEIEKDPSTAESYRSIVQQIGATLKDPTGNAFKALKSDLLSSVVKPETLYNATVIPQKDIYLESGRNQRFNIGENNQNARSAQTNAISRERLSQETATGQFTPETIDVLARTYLATGTLPPLGMGKSAAAARMAVLNQATKLGMNPENAPSVSAKDVAGNVVTNKQTVGAQTQAIKAFSTGVQGKQLNSMNVVSDHLDTMTKLADALQNNDLKAVNTVGQFIAQQTGSAAPTNFNAAKQIVSAEVIKAIVANGGGVEERLAAQQAFNSASSPQQLKGVIKTYKALIGGQLQGLKQQYKATTGRDDFDTRLSPGAKKTLPIEPKAQGTGEDAKSPYTIPGNDGKSKTVYFTPSQLANYRAMLKQARGTK